MPVGKNVCYSIFKKYSHDLQFGAADIIDKLRLLTASHFLWSTYHLAIFFFQLKIQEKYKSDNIKFWNTKLCQQRRTPEEQNSDCNVSSFKLLQWSEDFCRESSSDEEEFKRNVWTGSLDILQSGTPLKDLKARCLKPTVEFYCLLQKLSEVKIFSAHSVYILLMRVKVQHSDVSKYLS